MSDEIPVGSPPVPPGRHAAPSGWYADPAKQGQERYWDGWNWTRNTREAEAPAAPQQQWTQQPWTQQQSVQPGDTPTGAPQGYPTGAPGYQPLPGAVTADGVPLAGWWWRVLATIIDSIVLSILGQIVGYATGLAQKVSAASQEAIEYLASTPDPDFAQVMNLMMVPEVNTMQAINAGLLIVYTTVMLALRGATLGQMAAGLRTVPVGQGRHPGGIAWGGALIRTVAYEAFNLLWPVWLLDVFFPLWDRGRQTLHDKVARTQVVKVR